MDFSGVQWNDMEPDYNSSCVAIRKLQFYSLLNIVAEVTVYVTNYIPYFYMGGFMYHAFVYESLSKKKKQQIVHAIRFCQHHYFHVLPSHFRQYQIIWHTNDVACTAR